MSLYNEFSHRNSLGLFEKDTFKRYLLPKSSAAIFCKTLNKSFKGSPRGTNKGQLRVLSVYLFCPLH